MAVRVVVGNPFENQIGTVAPTASPVDTYVRPVVEKSPFETLATSLSNLERKAVPALARQEERMAKKEFAEGQRLYEENRIAIGEAVKKGIIAEGESPYVRKGYRVSQMNSMSARYADELERSLESKKLYRSGDPQKIEQFIKTFQADFVKNNGMDGFSDSELSTYFGQATGKVHEAFRSTWQKKHVAYTAAQAYKAFESEVATYTANLFSADQTPEEHNAALVQLKDFLEKRSASMATDGLDNGKVLDTILAGVDIAVEKTGSSDILDVFVGTKLGTDFAHKSLKVQGKMLDIQAKALKIQAAQTAAAEKQEEDRQELFRTEANRATLDVLQNPTEENAAAYQEQIRQLYELGDEKSVKQAIEMTQLMAKMNTDAAEAVASDPANVLDYKMQVSKATTLEEVYRITNNFIDSGRIEKGDITSTITGWQDRFDPAKLNQFGLNFFSSSTAEGDTLNNLRRLVLKNEVDYDDINKVERANQLQFQYQDLFLTAALEFEASQGRPMNALEKLEAAQRVYQALSAPIIKESNN